MAVSPVSQERLAETVRQVYVQVEQQLLEDIAKRVAKGGYSEGWREKKLAEVRKVRKETEKFLLQLRNKLPEHLKDVLTQAYQAGMNSADDDLRKYSIEVNSEDLIAGFGQVHTRAVEALVADQLQAYDKVHFNILRSTEDAYREVIAKTVTGAATGIETWQTSMQRALNHFADRGITVFEDSRGRKWSMATYTEMATRTALGNAAINGHLNRMRENRRDLVIVSDHKEECGRCRPYEGKVLSVSGDTPGYPTISEARGNGLFHPNCGHTVHAYIKGLTKVPTGTADPDGYEERMQQRKLERQIRKWKKRLAVAVTDRQRTEAWVKIEEYQQQIRDFVEKHNRLRDYWREQYRVGRKGIEKDFGDLPFLAKKAGAKKPAAKKAKAAAVVEPPKPTAGSLLRNEIPVNMFHTPETAEAFYRSMEKAPETFVNFTRNHFKAGISKITTVGKKGSYYMRSDRGVYMTQSYLDSLKPGAKEVDFKRAIGTLIHEIGHGLDNGSQLNNGGNGHYYASERFEPFRLAIVKAEAAFSKLRTKADRPISTLIKDPKKLAKAQQEKADAVAQLQRIKDRLQGDLLAFGWKGEEHIHQPQYAGLSDIVDGITKKYISGGYGHDSSYWKREGSVHKEVFANMYEMYVHNNQEAIDFMTEAFPEVVEAFNDLIKTM